MGQLTWGYKDCRNLYYARNVNNTYAMFTNAIRQSTSPLRSPTGNCLHCLRYLRYILDSAQYEGVLAALVSAV